MNPFVTAESAPNRIATLMSDTGESMTYGELARRASVIAGLLRARGFKKGDHIALMLSNSLDFHPICWGAWLAGLYFTPISTHLKAQEVAYIISDSGSRCVFVDPSYLSVMKEAREMSPQVTNWVISGEGQDGFECLLEAEQSADSFESNSQTEVGSDMLYSSGTTGRPKGILPALGKLRDDVDPLSGLLAKLYGFSDETVYLSPAPLYHGSPLKFTMAIHRMGGTNVIIRKFDAEHALASIEKYRVTHSQWVPTMMHRMYRLPDDAKSRYDLSSHQVAVHAAAPCPPELKHEIIRWWGPVVHEFYAGSEACGFTAINTEEWLSHPGSVGRAVLGVAHITDESGNELPLGQVGHIYFSDGPQIKYHNDPAKTKSSYLPNGWFTMGDMGYLDDEGFLYLSDRKDFMIISGGVNIYPKEIEDVLSMHPAVRDVAVFGIPHPEFGEEVRGVIEPVEWDPTSQSELAEAMIEYCRDKLSAIKAPRVIEFMAELPRMENGKLYKKQLRAQYLEKLAK